MSNDLAKLRSFIVDHYSLAEFRTLCFELGVRYDVLVGEGLADKVRELLLHLGRRGHLGDLLAILQNNRPSPFTQADFNKDPAVLVGEMSQAPGGEHKQTITDVAQGMVSLPPTPLPSSPHHNLPLTTSPFVGREQELAALKDLLDDPDISLITVLGPGGIGKTRLALETARRNLEKFEHGAYFVSLTPILSDENVTPTIAQALNFTFYAGVGPKRQLLEYLRQKEMLLIMDNFEQLPECASLVVEMVEISPGLQVIVTSRERLQLQHEQLFHIQGLDYPGCIKAILWPSSMR